MPESTGTTESIAAPGIAGSARIVRDRWGIAHVRATGTTDAFFAQGYAHATDRLWQMEASRRQAHGRWSECVGASGIASDTLARRLNGAAISRRNFALTDAQTREMLVSYAAGINAFLDTTDELPPEFELAGISMERWRPEHCIDVMRQRGFLMGSVWPKLWRFAACGVLPVEDVVRLRYEDGGQDLVCIPPGMAATRLEADVEALRPSLDALLQLAKPTDTDGGSNNWALAPALTTTGRPLLAGDPHRVFEMPAMYAQQHVASDEFDVIGLTVPGVPGFPHFAHNETVAWCVTHAFADIHDLYLERFRNTDALTADGWKPFKHRIETIKVRGGDDVQVEVVTTQHGPVIVGGTEQGVGISLRSVQFLDDDVSLNCLIPMMKSATVPELYAATRGWALIDHNLVAADTDGTIGHLVRAQVPHRTERNGWLPVPAWLPEHEWQGMIPADDMPVVINPDRGYLVTANNRFVADDSPYYFTTDCHPPNRARRIEQLIAAGQPMAPQEMQSIHRDSLSLPAGVFVDLANSAGDFSSEASRIVRELSEWDQRMEPDSTAATYYSLLRWEMSRDVARQCGLADAQSRSLVPPPGFVPENLVWWALPSLIRDDVRSFTGGRPWSQVCADALEKVAVAEPREWGAVHIAHLSHPLAGIFNDNRAELDPPGASVGGDNDTVWANGCVSQLGLQAAYGAVARYVFDVGNWDNCSWISVAGASGIPDSEHYADQHEPWSRCELIPMLYDWTTISAEGNELVLNPE